MELSTDVTHNEALSKLVKETERWVRIPKLYDDKAYNSAERIRTAHV